MLNIHKKSRKLIGKSHNGLKVYSRLKSKSKLKTTKPLKFKSDKQIVKDKNWRQITDSKCIELGFICQWCGKIGTRDFSEVNRLEGHHILPRRYNVNTPGNCYLAHRQSCHKVITDNSIDVRLYKNKLEWENKNGGRDNP